MHNLVIEAEKIPARAERQARYMVCYSISEERHVSVGQSVHVV